jgi:hypothetical protein
MLLPEGVAINIKAVALFAVRGSAALGSCSSHPNLTMENNVLNELSALSQSFSSRLILVDEYPERRNVRHLRDRICCRTLSSLWIYSMGKNTCSVQSFDY